MPLHGCYSNVKIQSRLFRDIPFSLSVKLLGGTVDHMKIDYTVQVWREGNPFIAHAMPLDVASSGDTPEAARNAADEAVRVFIAAAAAHGTLEEVLEDAGYRRESEVWRSPDWLGIEQRLAEV
jgi:predicted RNase H-like HicB family nuclease